MPPHVQILITLGSHMSFLQRHFLPSAVALLGCCGPLQHRWRPHLLPSAVALLKCCGPLQHRWRPQAAMLQWPTAPQ